MRLTGRASLLAIFLGGACLAIGMTPVGAQQAGMSRSLGGYGQAVLPSYYSRQGGPLLPYGGGQGVFIPYQGLEGRDPAAAMIPRPVVGTPIGGLGAGMVRTPIGGASRMQGPRIFTPFSVWGGMAPGGGGGPMSGPIGRGGMSPGLGSPFRQPAPLLGRGGAGAMGSM